MLKKLKISAILVIITQLILSGVVFATEALKEDQEKIQQEREVVKSKISEAEEVLGQLIQERQEINSEIVELNETIEQFEQMISETELEIEENEKDLQLLENEIELLQKDLDERNELLKERAVTYQKTGSHNISYLEVILGSESFSDFVGRLISLTKISQADDNFLEQTKSNQNELLHLQGEVEEILFDLEDQLQELEVIHGVVNDEKKKVEGLLRKIKDNEAEQERLITQLVKEEKELGAKEEKIRQEIEEEIRRQEEERRKAEEEARKKAEEERRKALEKAKNDNGNNVSRGDGATGTGRWQTYIATAYTAYCDGCSGTTFTGINLRDNPNAKVIAVDPSIIPLGSRVEIKGYGVYLAADIGGDIQGRRIDIFMSDRNAAIRFGRQAVELRIVN